MLSQLSDSTHSAYTQSVIGMYKEMRIELNSHLLAAQ